MFVHVFLYYSLDGAISTRGLSKAVKSHAFKILFNICLGGTTLRWDIIEMLYFCCIICIVLCFAFMKL